MALRLRRGTKTELDNAPSIAEGELIYVTDDQELYVGTGGTGADAVSVTGSGGSGSTTLDALTDTDLTGAVNNDVLTFNANTNKWESVAVPGVGILGLNDLSDVFLSNDPANGDILKFDGINFTASPFADLFAEQQTYKINIAGDDSTIIVDTDTNTVTGNFVGDLTGNVVGNVVGDTIGVHIGNVVGDVQGSVFGDDSTVIVDGLTNSLNTSSLNFPGTGFITTGNNELNIGFIDSVVNPILTHWNPQPGIVSRIYGLTNGDGTIESAINCSRGTLDNPLPLLAGDLISSQYFGGWENTSNDYTAATGVVHYIDPNATVTGSNMPGAIALFPIPDGDPNNTVNAVTIDSEGLVSIGRDLVQARATLDIGGTMALEVLTSAPASPVSGMVAIADGTGWDPLTNGQESMVVYLNSGWREIAAGV